MIRQFKENVVNQGGALFKTLTIRLKVAIRQLETD